jgi:hypothetical protein
VPDYDFKGPGVTRPHPRKNWINRDAHQTHFARSEQPRLATGPSRDLGGRSLVQLGAAAFGLVFLLVGIGGFIPGVTSNYDQLEFAGHDSQAELLGLFQVSILHNIVHLLFGVGLLAAASAALSKAYLIGGGVVYLGVAVFGFVVDKDSDANFLPLNDADNLLHVGLALAMILLGVAGTAAERRL